MKKGKEAEIGSPNEEFSSTNETKMNNQIGKNKKNSPYPIRLWEKKTLIEYRKKGNKKTGWRVKCQNPNISFDSSKKGLSSFLSETRSSHFDKLFMEDLNRFGNEFSENKTTHFDFRRCDQ
jgi:hypothetical protein